MDSTHESDRILNAGRNSLVVNRAGGHHRRSIGEGSARLKREHAAARLKRVLVAVAAIVVAAMGFGLFVSALGFEGLFVTVLAMIVAVAVLTRFPKMSMPRRDNLARGDLIENVARTELWLESQRPALPAPAQQIVDGIGVQLDGLGQQLRHLDENTPAAVAVRGLITRDLPEVVESYTRIPRHLRAQGSAGSTPDSQLEDSLRSISREIDTVTRQLAEGALDALAVRSRYLDYKYGDAMDEGEMPRLSAPDTPLTPAAPTAPALGTETPSSKEN
ncbi:hypothetical protein [Croceicoccus sp. BE223]|uniref:hypothetical protein n=1 Tax=Croceicoccus sp. BE223 TaxID=2817716 RepID=UPI00285A8EC2|nr:hypothetical protein [Croceicoccus sp. BE223]MDR7102651.1 hypothetical protein [Croceicoccus sp. BE223]